jgi:CDP-4-dehydro-6-deoxyglucose reductase, E1
MNKQDIETQIKILMAQWVTKSQNDKVDKVRYAGPVLGEEEYEAMLDAIFNDWWSGGKFTLEAETKLAEISERMHGLLANSGSSANLLLMSAAKELYFKDGDKILTLSCGFPTTVNPIIQNGLVPVFVDISLDDLNLDPNVLDKALSEDKEIKGVFVAHTLGFKSKIDELLDVARKHDVLVFFDNCDSYGTKYKGRPIQSYGKAATYSFYVAHHVTMGEGGGITTNDIDLHTTMRGMRNWGKYCGSPKCCIRAEHPDCFCPTGKLTKDSELPSDYMVNYQFEWLGYNLKPLDLQAAILSKQLDRIGEFDMIRKENYRELYNYFSQLPIKFKTWELDDETSPFSFPMLIPTDAKFNRKHLVDHMKRNKIETRVLFGGNLMKHPAYTNKKDKWESVGSHDNADNIMNNFIMFGVSQVVSKEDIEKIKSSMDDFIKQWS